MNTIKAELIFKENHFLKLKAEGKFGLKQIFFTKEQVPHMV